MFEPAEVFRLIICLLVLPPVLQFERQIRSMVARGPFLISFAFIYLSNVFTLAEGVFAPDLLNALQHLSYGVAGIAVLVGAVRILRSEGPVGARR